ncbi:MULTISPECIES: GDP-mannose 4,6-dehydratase [unclassified Prochlorococcus]|uniref:GDP-mannose 4,6-dehydratase n=1 Tax=unclassified Prochlorococcus TaxID=2627481 RepID=UPI00097CC857|nr:MULTISPECIES: GDP-mannose 4,6-dehydratase [unclassified Prochlorococcus]AQL29793.1 hypothetical protein BSR22_00740 [Prochlorococcus sp. RS50]AQL31576.1 hypothetical protein BS620_00735 [Prochlorococcus sp. RS01]AQL34528.1 hypothetical protein BS621_07055 [Prochlorococcus sp. RS04]
MNKTIFITGVNGQDGSLLADFFVKSGDNVIGTFRRGTQPKFWRLEELNIVNKIKCIGLDLGDSLSLLKELDDCNPDQIYHLAGDSFVADSYKNPKSSLENSVEHTINLLEAMRYRKSKSWCFIPSSSEIFAGNKKDLLTEDDYPISMSPYGLSKLVNLQISEMYRKIYNLRIASGILFNHESALRSRSFVTRKITYNLAKIKISSGPPMLLGNLNTSRDWSSAEDFVKGMAELGEKNKVGSFIFSSNKLTTLREFIGLACEAADFDVFFEGNGLQEKVIHKQTGNILCKVSENYFRISDTKGKIGSNKKLKSEINWEPRYKIKELVSKMVKTDIERRLNEN